MAIHRHEIVSSTSRTLSLDDRLTENARLQLERTFQYGVVHDLIQAHEKEWVRSQPKASAASRRNERSVIEELERDMQNCEKSLGRLVDEEIELKEDFGALKDDLAELKDKTEEPGEPEKKSWSSWWVGR